MSNSFVKYLVVGGGSLAMLSAFVSPNAKVRSHIPSFQNPSSETIDTPKTKEEKVSLPYDFKEDPNGNPLTNESSGGLMLDNPSNVKTEVEYDPVTGKYIVTQKIGDMYYRPPTYMSEEEYRDYVFKKQVKDYWNTKSGNGSGNNSLATNKPPVPTIKVGGEVFDRMFGGNTVDIQPNGSAELILGYNIMNTQNPAIPENNRKIGSMNFDEKIQLNVIGLIGEKLKITSSYNTEATFDFENQMKLEYTGYDDEIIKKIEAGNVNFPLKSSLMSGSQTLFGIKSQLQFGRLSVTSVAGQEKGSTSETEIQGGAQTTPFEISADNYDPNRHYFLAQYFRDQYDNALTNLPFVNSQVNITRIEVWVTNTNTSTTDIRSVVGFAELGENITHVPADQQGYITDLSPDELPFNDQNNLDTLLKTNNAIRDINSTVASISGLTGGAMQQQTNYELISSARKLNESEYTINYKLGYISLRQQLTPIQALCVAYQYTLNGKVYQVGEFSDAGVSAPQAIYAKMLKSTATNTKHPMWDLMMKNVYAIGAYQIKPDDFRLDVVYTNRETGTDINYLPVSDCQTNIHAKQLIQVMNVDKLNQQNDATTDGLFDYIEGVTVISNNGLIIFPVKEPFGSHLISKFTPGCSSSESDGYAFPQLYDSTKTIAQQYFPQFNRFKLRGKYQSNSSSEINLGSPNVAKGSVVVTAGGVTLTENVDYTVDYTLGRVKIINEGILNSGMPIKVKSGSNALFAVQQKTFFGTHLDYQINRDFVVGATVMNLTERPMNKKVNIGFEPVSNTVLGFDANYKTEAPFLTRLVDKIPFIDTKAPSFITASGEFAYLLPGHNKGIGKTGNSYIDDFEATQTTTTLASPNAWSLASVPQGQNNLFPEAQYYDSLVTGYNRAKLAWYSISTELLRQTQGTTPSNITNEDMSNNFVREVLQTEIFPNKQLSTGALPNINTFDLAYYPSEVGPYNFDAAPSPVSAGINANGNLNNPASRWAGIMRASPINDFQANNIEYIQFWVMDPFNEDNPPSEWNTSGDLYINIGNVSEDILNDGQRSSENGLPTPITPSVSVPTVWGQVPTVQPLVNTFNANETERPYQDVGFDGLANTLSLNGGTTEQTHYNNYLNSVQGIVSAAVYASIVSDPSHDDFHYFRGSDYDAQDLKILDRYKLFNGTENNSRTTSQSPESYPTASSGVPNVEDINLDNNLSTAESYFQYHISLKPGDFSAGVGNNYITNVFSTNGANIKDETTKPIKWYQFKIPIKNPDKVIGNIENFQSIRFIRLVVKGSDKPIVLRFASMELVRADWRKYELDIRQAGLYEPNDVDPTVFDVSAVNLEENGGKQPVNYVLPPNITRQVGYGTTNPIQLNEQALALSVCNLKDGDARAAFKNTNIDVRSYKKMEMFVHAEASSQALKDDDLRVFVRLGTDYSENYYEYEIPLKLTAPGFYSGENINEQSIVWPDANNMVLEFSKLQSAKQQRNVEIGNNSLVEYIVMDGDRKITVKGNPNLAAIRTIMVGIRNPKDGGSQDSDDGLSKCGQVWVNELRLTDFIENKGGAATGNVAAQLADLGNVAISGNTYAPGWGSIEDKVSERKRETMQQYNLTSSFELGKFLPEKSGIKIPMYAGYSETFIKPQYDPLAPDLILKEELKTLPKDEQEELKRITVDYTQMKSINFSNVRKLKSADKPKSHIYDIENWSASYAYSETFKRSINVEKNVIKNYKGGLNYSYSPRPKNIKPFANSKSKFIQSKYLRLIKDVNFYPYPDQLGFSTDVNRDFNSFLYRDVTAGDFISQTTYNKKINWNRNYVVGYTLTNDLKLSFTANNLARVREPDGLIDSPEEKDSVINNFKNLGETTQYDSKFDANYNIPVNKLPFLDFTKASVKYTATFNWQRASFNFDTLGNTIQNAQVITWSGSLNLVQLYNKSPFLRKSMSRQTKLTMASADSTKKTKLNPMAPVDVFINLLTSIKNVSGNYSINNGTLLPGYKNFTNMMGMDKNFAGPSAGFVFGSQKDIRETAVDNDWLVKNQYLNTPYTNSQSKNLGLKANVQPLKSLRIDLNGDRSTTNNLSEFFRWDNDSNQYVHLSPIETGNFSMSINSSSTSFKNGNKTFDDFLTTRQIISTRLGDENNNSNGTVDGFADGYNETSQDVLIPSFLAAYGGQNSNTVGLTPFPKIPKPNWRITYDGLSKIKLLKKAFNRITLSHNYKSSYSVGGYTSNLLFEPNGEGYSTTRQSISSISNNPNFNPEKLITTVSISEQWSPLLKVDVTLKKNISANMEFRKDRNISLGLTSKTITEILGREIVFGTGYRFKDIPFFKAQIAGKRIVSDLNLIGNLSIRRNETVIRRIVEENSQTTSGTSITSIKLSADYTISDKLNIRLFFDKIINNPLVSNSFPTSNTSMGLSLRLALTR